MSSSSASTHRIRLAAIVLLAIAVMMLLGRAVVREARPSELGATTPVYDPVAYYQLVNAEIVDDLRFCPLYADPNQQLSGSQALSRAAQLQFALDVSDEAGDSAPPPDCADCDAEGRRLNALFCLSPDTAATDGLAPRIVRFAEMSPLGADMSAADRWEYGPEGAVVRLREGIHKQRLPDPSSTHVLEYRGEFLFRASTTQKILIDGSGNERILGGGEDPAGLAAWRNDQRETDADGRLLRTSHSLPLDLAPVATIHDLPDMPDRIAVVVKEQSGRRLLIDGAPVDQTVRSVLAVDRGQVIEIELDDDEPLRLRLAGDRTGTLSTRRLTADGRRREIDPESGLDDLVLSLNSAIEGTLRRLNDTWDRRRTRAPGYDPRRLADADITLSIDRALQLQSVDSLERFATSPESKHNQGAAGPRYRDGLWWAGDSPRPFPQMTLTILDADNGDLLAMASYPNKQSVNAALERVAFLTGGQARLLREQLEQELGRTSLHLRPHAIGSIFKPFMAWAAGRANPELLEFQIDPGARLSDWNHGNLDKNRELTRCMISGRRIADKDDSHFHNAYKKPRDSVWRCDPNTTGEDVCTALAVSDTYYFLELMARVATLSRGATLPPAGTPDRKRDASYGLPELCGRQFVYAKAGKRQPTCAEHPRGASELLLPDSCPPGDQRPICMIVRDLGTQLQETNHKNDPSAASIDAYLGPLAQLVKELAADPPDGCGSGDKILLDGFRWAVPLPPQWPQNLMQSCTPDLEAFMEGGGLNYWNDVHIVQTFGRIFGDDPELQARLILQIGEPEDGAPPATRGRAIASVCAGSREPRCRVLHGLAGAVEHGGGTLKSLASIASELDDQPNEASSTPITVTLRGKTGTTRAPFPTFARRPKQGWVHAMEPRKSLHTALLLEVADANDNARHYVVYLAVNGVDDELTSSAVARFFLRDSPGYEVLRRLVGDALRDLEAAP